jgi:hypothetical protein
MAVGQTLRIYRWRGQWALDGIAAIPAGMPKADFGGIGLRVSSTSVTGGAAPDFTVHAYGADTLWFALAARHVGRWRFVPFDDQFGRRSAYTFAAGASHGLIEGMYDPCGCAGGPTTIQWYRFSGGRFEPTRPPRRGAVCSRRALAQARHWPPLDYDPLVRRVARGLRIARFACADGWALASDGAEVAVYEQAERGWLRIAVGSPHLVGQVAEFALSRSALDRLARKVGAHLAPLTPLPKIPPAGSAVPAWWKASILVRLGPGETYVPSGAPDRHPKILTARIVLAGGRSDRTVRFRWLNGHWVRLAGR